MSKHFDDLVALASGTATQVAGWCKLLRARNVKYVVASSCAEAADDRPDFVELWVHKDDVNAGRKILEAREMWPLSKQKGE